MQTLRKPIAPARRSRRRQRLVFTAALIGHGWLHRSWYRALARRFSPSRTLRARSAAGVNTLILLVSTVVIVLGIVAWLGPRGVKGLHGGISYTLLGLAGAHLLLNLRHGLALVRKRRGRVVLLQSEAPDHEELRQAA